MNQAATSLQDLSIRELYFEGMSLDVFGTEDYQRFDAKLTEVGFTASRRATIITCFMIAHQQGKILCQKADEQGFNRAIKLCHETLPHIKGSTVTAIALGDQPAFATANSTTTIKGPDMSKKVHVSGTANQTNVADFMNDVTNTVNQNLAQATVPDETKELISELSKQIDALSNKITPDQLQVMAGDLKTLTTEMASPQPRKKWYQLSIDGIKDAAEAVGEIGSPIIATVTKLLPLLI